MKQGPVQLTHGANKLIVTVHHDKGFDTYHFDVGPDLINGQKLFEGPNEVQRTSAVALMDVDRDEPLVTQHRPFGVEYKLKEAHDPKALVGDTSDTADA